MAESATIDTEDPDPEAMPDDGQAEGEGGGEDRPEWLPDKFDDPREMADSYRELESQFHGDGGDGDNDPDPEPDQDAGDLDQEDLEIDQEVEDSNKIDMERLNEDLRENDGQFSDEVLDEFEERGIPREAAQRYADGLKAQAREQRRELAEEVGGVEDLQNVLDWAGNNLSEEEVEAYNEAVQNGQMGQAKLQLRGIAAAYQESEGSEPDLVTGESGGGPSGVEGYSSRAEMLEDMQSDEYDRDPAFREHVKERLAATDSF